MAARSPANDALCRFSKRRSYEQLRQHALGGPLFAPAAVVVDELQLDDELDDVDDEIVDCHCTD